MRQGSYSREITAAAGEYTAERDFWLETLAGDLHKSFFPYDCSPRRDEGAGGEPLYESEAAILGDELTDRLIRLSNQSDARLYILLLAGFVLLLARYTGRRDIIVGSPVYKISAEGEYINRALALRVRLDSRATFKTFIQHVRQVVVEAAEHQNYPLETLLYKLDLTVSAGDFPLFDMAVLLENLHDPADLRDFPLNMVASFNRDRQRLTVRIDYNARRYERDTVKRINSHLQLLLERALADPELPLQHIELLSPEERERILHDFNRTEAPFPRDRTIQQLFEAQAVQQPYRIAVVEGECHIDFRQFNRRADRLAGMLLDCGLKVRSIVGILAPRSVELLAALMGVLKSGAAYLPIETEYPEERIRYMLRDSGAAVLLTLRKTRLRIPEEWVTVISFSHFTANPAAEIAGGELETVNRAKDVPGNPWAAAYCIYTSGSTGKPKGVLIEHRSALNYLWWAAATYVRGEAVNFPLFTSISFDLTVTSAFTPLLTGNVVVIYGEGGWPVESIVAENRVDVVKLTPSHLKLIRHIKPAGVCRIKRLIVGGEELETDLAGEIHDNFNGNIEIYNEYGPTEATVGCMIYRYDPQKGQNPGGSVPIGVPAPNVQLYVLDPDGNPVPFAVNGQLHIAGSGLARGYLNRPELTAEKFVSPPAGLRLSGAGSLYRSGDLAWWLPGGDMVFSGRIDQQVKIRGYRIEPTEIESLLTGHPAVREAVLTAFPDPAGERRLAAYVVPDEERAAPLRRLLRLEKQAVPAGKERCRLPDGSTVFYLNRGETDFMYTDIVEEGGYLKQGIELEDGAVIFDVGGNIGIFPLFVRQICRDFEIYIFEPMSAAVEVMKLNMAVYDIGAKVFEYGLAADPAEREGTFLYCPRAPMFSCRYSGRGDDLEPAGAFLAAGIEAESAAGFIEERLQYRRLTCPVMTLSRAMEINRVERIDLLKISAENSELEVLAGIEDRDWPRIAQVAVTVYDRQGRLSRLTALLESRGYRVTASPSSLLTGAGLYRVYAVRPEAEPRGRRVSGKRPSNGRPETWCGPEQLEESLRGYLEERIPDYMIPSFFMFLPEIPLTVSGKVDRSVLPPPRTGASGVVTPPGNELERTLIRIWSEVLGVEEEKIGIHHNFFQLGGHSLKVSILAVQLHKVLNIRISMVEIFDAPTVRQLAEHLKEACPRVFTAILPVEKKDYYDLSSAQKRLYVLQQIDTAGIGYNITSAYKIEGRPHRRRLAETFRRLIRRHRSFSTSFHLVEGRPVQRVHDVLPFEIDFQEPGHRESAAPDLPPGAEDGGSALSPHRLIQDFMQPFDLSRPPLLRVRLMERLNLLLIDMHHIISDGTSTGIFIADFINLYGGGELPPLRINYVDYAAWLGGEEQAAVVDKHREYWLREYEGDIPVLTLPADFSRPALQSFSGSIVNFKLDPSRTAALKELAEHHGATLFMALLAVLNLLLSRLSGQEDIVVGTPIAARSHADLDPLIGMFVNTLALRNRPHPDMSFAVFLERVREKTIRAFDNQAYPFEELVEKVVVGRDTGRNPLFDVMFAFQNIAIPEWSLPGLRLTPYPFEYRTAKFDLNLDGTETADGLEFTLEYAAALFKQATVERFAGYFEQLIASILEEPALPIKNLDILSPREHRQLLEACRGPAVEVDRSLTLCHLFEGQVEKGPDCPAVIWTGCPTAVHGGTVDPACLTYSELSRRARRLAEILRSRGAGPDQVVGLLLERSLEMVIGVIGILMAGAACLPLDPDYPPARLDYMISDSGTALIVTSRNLSNRDQQRRREGVEPVLLEGIDFNAGSEPDNYCQPGSLLYVIYTSGSTGRPKGVMLEQVSLVNLVLFQFNHTHIDCSRVLQFATICFDVSFQEIFSALLSGGSLFLLHRQTRTDIPALCRVIEDNRIGTLFLPASFLRLLFGGDDFIAMLPACVRHIVSAGEQLAVSAGLRRYLQHRGVYLHNHYGPSETHVVTALTLDPRLEIPDRPTIGRPIQNTGIYIVDRAGRLQPPGVSGELLIAGLSVGRGYRGRPELTARKFRDNPFLRGERLYRTGDLARLLPEGDIEFLGRLDHQVKIRGFRVEPAEIENRLLRHPHVKEAVVTAREDRREEHYLAAYILLSAAAPVDTPYDTSDLKEYLHRHLPDYMVPAFFILLDRIPLTPNRKVDRSALPEPAAGDTAPEYTAPGNEVEAELVRIWADILGLPADTVGVQAGFFQSGGHSLKAILLISRIHKTFNVRLPMVQIFKTPTVRGLSEYINEAVAERYRAVDCTEKKEYYPLTPAQKRFYILHQLQAVGESYNMPTVVVLKGPLKLWRLEEIFVALIQRHDSLRTSFGLIEGEAVQRIHPAPAFQIDRHELNGDPAAADRLIRAFIRPFDLSRAPLLRVGVIRRTAEAHILMVDMDHIVSDGISHKILVEEFVTLYARQPLAPLRLQYRDFSYWQQQRQSSGEKEMDERYWLEEFGGTLPVLRLPLDFPRPPAGSFAGDHAGFEIPPSQTLKLKELAARQEVTLYILILAIYYIFLGKISGQEDIVVGTVSAGRQHPDLERIIGVFINTLALRNHPRGTLTFPEFLRQVRQQVVTAFDRQNYPFEELVEKLSLRRDGSRNPLFDVMFVFSSASIDGTADPYLETADGIGLKIEDYEMSFKQSRFDLLLGGSDRGERLVFDLEYCTALFRPETAARFIGYFKEIVAALVDDSNVRLRDIKPAHQLETMPADAYDDSRSLFDF